MNLGDAPEVNIKNPIVHEVYDDSLVILFMHTMSTGVYAREYCST